MSENQTDTYLCKSKSASIILIVSIVTCIISTQLGQIQAISDFNFTLHEMLYIPLNIGIFLIPLELLFLLYFFIRWIINIRKGIESSTKKYILINIIGLLCFLLYCLYFIYLSNSVSTSGIYEKLNKEKHDNKYYLVIENKRLSCSRNEYNLISTDRKYLISYKWNKLTPQNGKIDYIEEAK